VGRSTLPDGLIRQRKNDIIACEKYLAEIVALTIKTRNPAAGMVYPAGVNISAKRALYDNPENNEDLAGIQHEY
jgi:hypothetical protein